MQEVRRKATFNEVHRSDDKLSKVYAKELIKLEAPSIQRVHAKNFLATDVYGSKKTGMSFKSALAAEVQTEETFAEMWHSISERYFGQAAQSYYHVADATEISREVWTHNDFPYEKFLTESIDESILSWQPARANPSQLNSEVQSKLTATLGKHAIVIPPKLEEQMKTDSLLRQKVMRNVDRIYKFHMQPPAFKMPGVKEYGVKLFGSVTILDSDGEVKNCVVTSGGTITGPDEETLRQIELERERKLKRKEFNAELALQARIEYITARN